MVDPGFPRQGDPNPWIQDENLFFDNIFAENCMKTRMHSSRMRTARSLTVSPSMLCSRGGGVCSGGSVCSRGGVCSGGCLLPGECLLLGGWLLPGGVCSGRVGVSAPRGCLLWEGGGCLLWGCLLLGRCLLWGVCSGGVWYPSMHWGRHPPVNRMTDRCKNITLPQTSFVGGNERNWTDNVNITCSILPGKAKVKVLILCHPEQVLARPVGLEMVPIRTI